MPRKPSEYVTVSDVIQDYVPDIQESSPMRLAKFLKHVAEVLPESFVGRHYAAKVAFAMQKSPKADSDRVKIDLPRILSNTKNRLQKDFGMTLVVDKFEGIRATHSVDDIARTEHRRKRMRVVSAINGFEVVDNLVEVDEVRNPDLREEIVKAKKAQEFLAKFKKTVPLLPPGSKDRP